MYFLYKREKTSSALLSHDTGMGMEVFATLAGAAIQGQIVGVHHAKRTRICSLNNDTEGPYGNYSETLDDKSDTLQNTVRHREHPSTIMSNTY